MALLLNILAILLISFVFIYLAYKLRFSEVIGLIGAGLFLALPGVRDIFIVKNEIIINNLANIGLFTLMLVTGFEISRSMLRREGDDSLILTLLSILFSFFLGFLVFKFIGFSFSASLVVGVCFSITAEATKARSLLQLDEVKTRIGALLLEAGIINDIFGIAALMAIAHFFAKSFYITEFYVIGAMILAFILGIMIHIFFDRETAKVKFIEKVLLHTLVPFFFINMALKLSSSVFTFDFWLLWVVFIVSSAGPILGAFASRFFINLKPKQAWIVAAGMNSKGAVELVIAYVALNIGILPTGLYSALVLNSIVSTIVFHIIAYNIMAKNRKLMN